MHTNHKLLKTCFFFSLILGNNQFSSSDNHNLSNYLREVVPRRDSSREEVFSNVISKIQITEEKKYIKIPFTAISAPSWQTPSARVFVSRYIFNVAISFSQMEFSTENLFLYITVDQDFEVRWFLVCTFKVYDKYL